MTTDGPHIGLVAPEFPPELGGVQTYSWELAAALAKAGCKVTVLAPVLRTGDIMPKTPMGVTIHHNLRFCHRHDARLLAQHPGVTLWHGLTANCAWLVNATRLPVFLSLHGNDLLSPNASFHHPRWRERFHLPCGSRFERWWALRQARYHLSEALNHASALFCNSEFTAGLARARSKLSDDRTIVAGIGLGAEFQNIAPAAAGNTDGRTRFVTVARLDEPRKNIDRVLRALAMLPAGIDWSYSVIGGGGRLNELQGLANALGFSSKVEFTGPIPRDQMISKLQESDLFVLTPSADVGTVEGFGIVYLEANACGLPVLASHTGGVPDAVRNNISGWLIDDPSPELIASALQRFIASPRQFDRDNCRRYARTFTWDRVAARCLEAYLQ